MRRFLGFVMAAVAVLASGLLGLGLTRLHAASPLDRSDSEIVADALPRLSFLRSALDTGSAQEMQQLFPEGYFFNYVLYGLTWLDVGARSPELKDRALAEARWALQHTDSPQGRAVFMPGSVFYIAWSAWLRGGVARLAGPGAPEIATVAAEAKELAELFGRNTFPDSYPGQAWPCDSVVGIAALRLADVVTGGDHSGLIASWLKASDASRDLVTGLLPHTTDGDGPRATSQVIILRFLPEIDPVRAARDWSAFRAHFSSQIPGIPGIREYPHGIDKSGDVDSGPLIFGLSASASAVAIGDAVLYRDRPAASALTGLAEATGMAVEFDGRRRYLGGVMPIGDAFLAWSMAARPWLNAVPETASGPSWTWRIPWYVLAVQLFATLWTLTLSALTRRLIA